MNVDLLLLPIEGKLGTVRLIKRTTLTSGIFLFPERMLKFKTKTGFILLCLLYALNENIR